MAGHLIRRLNQHSTHVFQQRTKAAALDLTPVQFAAMGAVRDNPGIDQAGVAGLIAYDRATLGKVIDRLEAKALVRRKVSPSDRRAREVTLTQAGKVLLAQVHPVVCAAQPDILAGLSAKEQDQFVALLKKATLAGNEKSRAPQRNLPRAG